jgi:hypothetical protein
MKDGDAVFQLFPASFTYQKKLVSRDGRSAAKASNALGSAADERNLFQDEDQSDATSRLDRCSSTSVCDLGESPPLRAVEFDNGLM